MIFSFFLRNLQIKVSQIPGHTKWTAIPDCLQYHTGHSGTFRAFNHPTGTLIQAQLYQICIRQEEGSCSIAYRQIFSIRKDNLVCILIFSCLVPFMASLGTTFVFFFFHITATTAYVFPNTIYRFGPKLIVHFNLSLSEKSLITWSTSTSRMSDFDGM